jgi:hypothetical protein
MTQSRVSLRAILALRRLRFAFVRRSAARVVASAPGSLARSLKEGRAPLAPALLRDGVVGLDCGEQDARELLDRQRIRTGGNDQLPELVYPAFLSPCRRAPLVRHRNREVSALSCSHCMARET